MIGFVIKGIEIKLRCQGSGEVRWKDVKIEFQFELFLSNLYEIL